MKNLRLSFTSNGVEVVTVKLYKVTKRSLNYWQVYMSRSGVSELLGEFENRYEALEFFQGTIDIYI